MASATLDGRAVADWDSFHTVCAAALEFPGFYGRNLNAWIDCLSYLRDGDGMSRSHLGPAEVLTIHVVGSDEVKRTAPEVFAALVETTAAVNSRYESAGTEKVLKLVLE